jgi:predicted permease
MVLNNLILVFTLIFLGYLCKRSGRFPTNTADVLNRYVLDVALPAIILVNIPNLPSLGDMLYPITIHWSTMFVHIAVLFFLGKLFKLSKSILGVLIVVSTLGNTSFLGFPMVVSLMGQEALVHAILYDQLGSLISFILYGALVIPLFVETGEKVGLKEVLIKLFTFPAFIALLVAFVIRGITLPVQVTNIIEMVAATLIPVVMVAVGFQMKFKHPVATFKYLALGLSLKMIFVPLLALAITMGLGWAQILAANVSVVESGMPPMVTAGALAISYNLEKDLAAALVGYGLFASFLTLPILKYLMLHIS